MADWILPRRGPPGLNSPFLIECRGAYRVFDRTGSPPRLVVAIGDDEKRRFLQQALNAPIYASGGIALRPLLPSTIVADCDLQNLHELLPIDSRRPRDEDCRHAVLYPPEIHSVQIVELAQELCWQALAPFSCLILFFARDFHGLDPVAHFLSAWVQRAMADPIEAPPRILVVCDELKETQRALIRHLRANLRAAFQALDPRRRVSSSSVNSHYRKAFESVQLLPSIDAETLHLHTEDLFAVRGLRGLAFSSHHLKALLQQVIRDFGRNPRQAFNVYSASRLRNPVAADLSDHVVNLFLASKGSDLDVIPIVASALEFNAHPPGMHFFHPRRTFENFYQAALSRAEGRLALHDLTSRVRQRFVVMAMQRREQSSAQAHLRFLAQQVSWEQCRSDDTCLMCVAQRPSVTLTCEHRLCNPCAIVCSGSGSGPCPVPRCPLCQAENDRAIELRPPTAGLRVLELGGTVHHKLMVLRFLKDVERKIGMRRYPLGKHFDLVVGSEIGAYFVQTVFLEGWSLADCAYHFRRLDNPKLDVKRSVVSFGSGLEWDLGRTKYVNSSETTLVVRGHTFYTSDKPSSVASRPGRTEIAVHCQGVRGDDPQAAADRLFASLFYLELTALPDFYAGPERACLRLQCRVPPGPALVDLVTGLQQRQARMYYGGDNTDYASELLVSPKALARCRRGGVFSRALTIPVRSMSSPLDVRIDGLSGPQHISNCPYELQKLVRDQGLDCVFGRKDHRDLTQEGASTFVMFEAIDRLSRALEGVISLWATRLSA